MRTQQCVRAGTSGCAADASSNQGASDAATGLDDDATVLDGAARDAPPDSEGDAPGSDSGLEAAARDATVDAQAEASLLDASSTEGGPGAICAPVDGSAGVSVATTGYGYGTAPSAIVSSTQRIVWTGLDNGTIMADRFDIGPDAGPPSSTSIEPGADGGWSLPRVMVASIAINPWNNLDTMVAMTGQSHGVPNLFRTNNGGNSFSQVTTLADAGISEVWSISFNPLDPSYLYVVGAPDGRVVESGDNGATWSTSRPSGDPIAVGDGGALISSATLWKEDPNYVVVGTSNGQVWETGTGGQGGWTWLNDPSSSSDASAPMPERPITRVLANPRVSPPMLVVTYVEQAADSVWMSATGGYLWQTLPTGLPNAEPNPAYAYFGASLQWLTLFPASSGTSLYLQLNGTCGTAFSPDLGGHWTWFPSATP